ncbi:hypothetical protein N7491_010625 [Penicillium cf. griseofulvum]|uniref:Uncharacterized protein n=1 Tax=Penicillium cf. griseofulvum TaxID=2972120 RepID=A0A9W9T612_9EURO|nr:hypothetical protein N7472_000953 [Penicillium cf. griseofulvum]KAJ5422180.1 hypothetical protein N7491_010625 [Penicillium cf. griseofulvum]
MPFEQYKRNCDRANAFMERIMNGISNHEILARAKKLYDENLAEVPDEEREIFSDHVYELPKSEMTKHSLPVAAKYKLQLHASFDKPNPNADYSNHSNVYLVGRPNRWARGLSRTQKPCRWFIYTNGHAYHLKLAGGTVGSSITLQVDSGLDMEYPPEHSTIGPFIAYHIGTTDYHAQQISLLGKWVIEQLDHHDLSIAACEQFVFGLGIRIIRGPSNTISLFGTIMDIGNHDTKSTYPSGFHTGVRLSNPDEDISTWAKRCYLIYRIETDARGLDLCWKRGKLGQIDWKTHEYHPLIRPFAVGPPAIAKIIVKIGQRLPALSKAVPPRTHRGMCVAAIYRLLEGAPVPICLDLEPFYGTLCSIRTSYKMSSDEFYFLVDGFLHSSFVKQITYNRGFNDEFLRAAYHHVTEFTISAGSSTGDILHSSSSTLVDNPELTVENRHYDTLGTHLVEHGGIPCQVLIDLSDYFKSPVEEI